MPLLFSTYGGHCVASLFNMVACYSLSLLWQVVFCLCKSGKWCFAQSSVSIISFYQDVRKTFTKKILRINIHVYRNTVPPWLISHHRREKQDKWTVGEKKK